MTARKITAGNLQCFLHNFFVIIQMSNLKTNKVRSIHLEITGRCNIKCIYCYNSQFNSSEKFPEEMTTVQIKKLIDEAKELGCEKFTFSGGDPFLREDLFDIIEYCKDKKVHILTNAKLLSSDLVDRLSKYPHIGEIKITLDGFEGHNVLRNGSDYKEVIKSIKRLKKKKIKVVINTEVTEINLGEMKRLYKLLKKLKIDRWRVDLPFILGRYKENYSKYKLSDFKDFINIFKDIIKDYLKKKPSFEFELFNIFKSEIDPDNLIKFDANIHPCEYRTGSFPMRPNGDMVFCPSMDMPMSNFVKSGSLKKAIAEKYENKFYNIKVSDIKECQDCRYLKLCGTGCRVDSFYYLGDFLKPDPINCNLMPLMESEIIPILGNKLKAFLDSLIDKEKKFPNKYDINELAKKAKNT